MKVLVTGGTGLIGRATTERLLQQGWEVRVIDLAAGTEIPGAEYVACDVTDYDALRVQVRGCQAVVHLAAIPRPTLAPGDKVFHINTSGTFNVFEAAAAEGIKRVVQASSINALGVSFSLTDIVTKYFPVDENHPTYTTDPYSLSKELVEDIGAYYWRRDGISSIALRFPGVRPDGRSQDAPLIEYAQKTRDIIDELAALTPAEREARLAPVRQRVLDWRKSRPMEYKEGVPTPITRDDTLFHIYAIDRFNLWSAVDVRDAAQALEKGLTADYDGAHPFFISDSHNWLGYDSKKLINIFFPHIADSNIALSGTESLLSIKTARQLIGYEPIYSTEVQLQSAG